MFVRKKRRTYRRPSRKARVCFSRHILFEPLERRLALSATAVEDFTKIDDRVDGLLPIGTFLGVADFGSGVANLGDLDGDGINDLAAGARHSGSNSNGAVFVLFMKSDGTVKSHVKIQNGQGGLPEGTLNDLDNFGFSLTSLGDLDGDGAADLAVGAPFDDTGGFGRGAVHILFLNSDGTVKANTKIGDGTNGLPENTLADDVNFGFSVAAIADLNGDGVVDLAVGAPDDESGIRGSTGALYVLFMNTNGTIKDNTIIANGLGGLGQLPDGSFADPRIFGSAITSLGDLDTDGVTDIAVGAMGDHTGAGGAGAVFVLFMNDDGTVKSRTKLANGQGGIPVGTFSTNDALGRSLANLGDMNGDGIVDLAAYSEEFVTNNRAGAIHLLFLDTDGTIKSNAKIADGEGGLPENTLSRTDYFGRSLVSLGDINGDGVSELAAGAPEAGSGAVYILNFGDAFPNTDTDFGDAPLAIRSGFGEDYPVTLAQDGARHLRGELFLGTLIDGEDDGQPEAVGGLGGFGIANGDDAHGDDDEDGVAFIGSLLATSASSTTASASITASPAAVTNGNGKLDAWIDFNHDGDWDDVGEQIFTSEDVGLGLNVLSFTVPAGATSGETFARFRISPAGGLAPTGAADDGEVEDYPVMILDGDADGGADVEIELPTSGMLDITADGDDVVLRAGAIELFRAPGSSVKGLHALGTSGDDTLNLANLDAIFGGIVTGDAGHGNDRLSLGGSGQHLDLTQIADDAIQGLETIDISGGGSNSLTLNVTEVVNLSSTTDTLRVQHDDDDTVNYGSDWTVGLPQIFDGEFAHILEQGSAMIQVANTRSHHNPLSALDSNRDGGVAPIDALVIINRLNAEGPGALLSPTSLAGVIDYFYFDTNADGSIAPIDVLVVVNFLNDSSSNAEGESPSSARSATIPAELLTSRSLLESQGRSRRGSTTAADEYRDTRPPIVHPAGYGSGFARSTNTRQHEANLRRQEYTSALDVLFDNDADSLFDEPYAS